MPAQPLSSHILPHAPAGSNEHLRSNGVAKQDNGLTCLLPLGASARFMAVAGGYLDKPGTRPGTHQGDSSLAQTWFAGTRDPAAAGSGRRVV